MKNKFSTIYKIISFAIVIIFFISINIIYSNNKENKKFIENFENVPPSTYNDCINKGFSKEFCVQTPISALGTNICRCENGNVGRILPGFRGDCIC